MPETILPLSQVSPQGSDDEEMAVDGPEDEREAEQALLSFEQRLDRAGLDRPVPGLEEPEERRSEASNEVPGNIGVTSPGQLTKPDLGLGSGGAEP